jgi:5'-nucleotidase
MLTTTTVRALGRSLTCSAWLLAAISCSETTLPVIAPSSGALAGKPHPANCQDHDDDSDSPALRAQASQAVRWKKGGGEVPADRQVKLQILGFNDYHGQLSPRTVAGRPAGGAAVFTSYLKAAAAGLPDSTFIVNAGDSVGASPPNSALLQDEPTLSMFNALANEACKYENLDKRKCNLVGTLGNHEFDEGKAELLRLLQGGNHPNGPFLDNDWKGARFPYVSANVIDESTGKPLLPPYVIKKLPSIPVAFIGAVLEETPSIVTPTGVAGLRFIDEADAINSYIPELHAQGIHTIIVLIHQGLSQPSYTGPTSGSAAAPNGALLDVVSRLHDDIDVVVSGHTHAFTNALIPNSHGVPILVAQAFSASTAYDDIDLIVDKKTNDVVSKTAQIITTWGDEGPGLTPDPAVAAIVAAADQRVAPLVNQLVGQTSAAITRTQNAAGESALGDLIADAQRASVGATFAFMNAGGIRADLDLGPLTWGELFAVQPFGNTVVALDLTGQQIFDLLNQQWGAPQPAGGRVLQISGLRYTWDGAVPEGGKRVTEVRDASGPISLTTVYRVAVNNFIATGGDNFAVLSGGQNQVGGPVDLDALVEHIETLPQPFSATVDGRITRR